MKNITNKTAVIVVSILVVALATSSPIFSTGSFAAQGTGVISGIARPAGSITCPDGSIIRSTGLGINASEPGSGNYDIVGLGDSGSVSASGQITKAQINENNFHLSGTGTPVCSSGSSQLTDISLSGVCGAGLNTVIVSYRAASGEKGTVGEQGGC